ncbi:hypothetical protein Aduo_012350 [Ancylostoma duodenale]
MNTPLSFSSVPAFNRNKRRHVDSGSPDVLAQLLGQSSQQDMPAYVRVILEALMETRELMTTIKKWCEKVSEENTQLKSENSDPKKLIQQKESQLNSLAPPPSSQSSQPSQNSVDPFFLQHEFERQRSVVISGLPESNPYCVSHGKDECSSWSYCQSYFV